MKRFVLAVLLSCFVAVLTMGLDKPAAAQNPFVESAYLYNQAFDTDINSPNDGIQGSGNWLAYYNWIGYASVGAEGDPGQSSGDWWDCCGNVSWNGGWAAQQARYGSKLGPIILSIGQMPYSPNGYDTTWENQEWENEAADDSAEMANFKSYVDSLHADGFAPNSVIIRLGYEFDGGWNSWGNLNVMSNMPANYIAAWQNIVTAMRQEDAADGTPVIKGFLWNPTTGNIDSNYDQIWQFSYYPGDAYVDYIGMDEYDYDYGNGTQSQEDLNGEDGYTSGFTPTAAEQANEWNDIEKPRLDYFANFASAANPDSRNGYISGRSVPLIFGEWGLWQVASGGRPAGGDNPSYISNMYNWMCAHNVYDEVYFEAPADGISSLSPIFEPGLYPNSTTQYLTDFGGNGGGGGGSIANGTYYLVNNCSSLGLDDPSGGGSGTGLDQQPYTTLNQKWVVTSVGGGEYKITSAVNGLAVTGASFAQLTLSSYTGATDQLWSFTKSGSFYSILNEGTGQVMDDWGQSTSPGNVIGQYTANGQTNQQWSLVATTGGNPIAYVQGADNGGSAAATSQSVTLSSQHAGDLNVVIIGYNAQTSSGISSVTDSAGNTYQLAVGYTYYGDTEELIYYAPNIKSSSSNTVTVTYTGSIPWPDFEVMEFSGVSTLDKTATGTGWGNTAATGNVTTTAANELLIGGCCDDQYLSSPGSGYTFGPNDTFGYGGEYEIVSSAGSYNAGMTLSSSGDWTMELATFK